MKKLKRSLIDCILGLILPFTVVFIAQYGIILEHGFVIRGDLGFPIYLDEYLSQVFNAWNHYTSSPNGAISYINVLIFAIPHWLGASADVSEKIWLLVSYASTGTFMYFAMRILLPKKSALAHYGACTVASLTYMINKYALVLIHLPGHLLSSAALPLAIALYMRTLRGDRGVLRNAILTSVTLSLTVFATHTLALAFFAMIVAFLYRSLRSRGSALRYLGRNVLIFFLFITLNAYWIIPQYLAPTLPEAYFPSYIPPLRYNPEELGLSRYGHGKNVVNVLTLNLGYGLELPITVQSIAVGSLMPIVAFSFFLFRRKEGECYEVASLSFILFTVGTLLTIRTWPFILVSDFLGRYIFSSGLWWAFIRNPDHFSPLVIYSLSTLTGLTSAAILGRLTKPIEEGIKIMQLPRDFARSVRLSQLLAVSFIALLLLSPWILYSGYPASGECKWGASPHCNSRGVR